MKFKRFMPVVLLLLVIFSGLVWGASPAQYLRSRLTVLAAKLYQEINTIIEPGDDYHYSLGLLPLLDVNGEKAELALFLHKQMEEVIAKFPDMRIVSSVDVVKVWTELKKDQTLSDEERFRRMGEKLKISCLVMSSLVTHPTHYTINALVVNTKDGKYEEMELIILERSAVELLMVEEQKAQAEAAAAAEQTSSTSSTNNPETPTSGTPNTNSPTTQQPGTVNPDTTPVNQPGPITPPVTTNPGGHEPATPPVNTLPWTSAQPEKTVETPQVVDKQYTLKLKSQSPLLTSLLFGFDLGDVNGDGTLELVITGVNLQVRNLNNYYIMWQYDKFAPPSNDYKILTADVDGDGSEEILGHNLLLKVVNGKLVTQQPRFISRPVALYGNTGIAIFNQGTVYVVNYQGLVMKRYSLGEGYGKRFVFTDLEGDGIEEFVTTMQGEDEGATVQAYKVDQTLKEPRTIGSVYGYAVHSMDLNKNGRPEIYLRRNFFSGDNFLYSKIYVLESVSGELKQIYESPELDFFIVDFSSSPDRLVVGGMYLKHKKQSIQEIKSRIFFYNLE